LAHALAEFGPHRCLFGSAWPVMTLAATYLDWLDLIVHLGPAEGDRRGRLAPAPAMGISQLPASEIAATIHTFAWSDLDDQLKPSRAIGPAHILIALPKDLDRADATSEMQH